jgi:N4-gp56 family major capsid protein
MADIVLHSDLTDEQITYIEKAIKETVKHEPFWDKFCDHVNIPAGNSDYKYRKLVLTDPTAIQELAEGVTPSAEKMTYATFDCKVKDCGRWIEYTDADVRYNPDSIVDNAHTVLANDAVTDIDLIQGAAFLKSACTLTTNPDFLALLVKAGIVLRKNKAKPFINGRYVAIVTPETAGNVLIAYKDAITHTSENNAIIDGYLGELGGFVLYQNSDAVMYKDATTGYVVFMGKDFNGQLPVSTNSIGESGVKVYDTPLGSLGNDPLHQRGAVGYKFNLGAAVRADEALLISTQVIAQVTESVNPAESTKTGYVSSSSSPK